MIIDTFLFGWELDLLECRLTELEDVVDVFVIVEASSTFQGRPKDLYYMNNVSRYRRWNDRILYVNPSLSGDDPWQREYASRNVLNEVLSTFPRDAIVFHSDVDEFPSEAGAVQAVEKIGETQQIYGYRSTMYSMAINWLYPTRWLCTMAAPISVLEHMGMLDLRSHRFSLPPECIIEDGWHFSWLGGLDFIKKKAQAFSHTEDSVQNYVRDMGERLLTEGYHVLGEKLIPVNIDNSYPKYVQMGKYPHSWIRPI